MDAQDSSRPDPELVCSLLKQRYPFDRRHALDVELDEVEAGPRVTLRISRPKSEYTAEDRLVVEVVRMDGDDDPWSEAIDAADALFGMLVESDYAYRELPTGDGVEHNTGTFGVKVTYRRPGLDAQADALLNLS